LSENDQPTQIEARFPRPDDQGVKQFDDSENKRRLAGERQSFGGFAR
jgi:hypothetical protein